MSGSEVSRRTALAMLAAASVLLEGCPGHHPNPDASQPLPPTSNGTDFPADGADRFDFSGDLPG